MISTSVTVGSATKSAWIPLDPNQAPFAVGFGVTLPATVNLTYKVQHSFDTPARGVLCQITRSTTTATLTLTDHGLTTSDSIVVSGAGAPFDGTYDVAGVTNANVITYTVSNSGAALSDPAAKVAVMRVFDHPVVTGKTAASDGNYAFPVRAVRLNVTAYTSGKATLTLLQGSR